MGTMEVNLNPPEQPLKRIIVSIMHNRFRYSQHVCNYDSGLFCSVYKMSNKNSCFGMAYHACGNSFQNQTF